MKWMISILVCAWMPIMLIGQETQFDPNRSELPTTSYGLESSDFKAAFDSTLYLGEESWKVYSKGKVGFIDQHFGISISPEYDDFLRLDLLCLGVKKGNLWAIYSEGEFISDFIFSSILTKVNDCYVVSNSGGYRCYKDGEYSEEGFYMRSGLDVHAFPCDPETGICVGTESDFMRLISKYVRYPAEARENGIQGTVLVALHISEFGDLDYVKVVKSAGDALDNAAIDLFTEVLYQFNPAELNGIPVPSVVNFPLRFRLN